ncbi:NADPH-dependent FMN reductase (plasmid) [Stanieria cyanosphaera PCC 7437]|uniref:NADPH-dependent FMN reductase n=1 Tax=Stanieria cyanosphaera (strain ATCC 29371 / PCC 7437) TaxID=111780 RepID=K9Y1N3_STAC7|nr:NAD(P)H-dependent oxidoreductase [Stanieria cyanosphaera]AFZ38239.1 NADPH-dependent FMN reductase [Stanieria cyanosphaera PCC 7437]
MTNLFIPVILGTTRQGRMSEPVALFVEEQVSQWSGVETELIDIRQLHFPIDDAGQEIKAPEFAATCERADGLILVVPEYNHSFPGWLKHVLDTNLEEYIHKAIGICGVSASPFGGTRVIQSLLPVMRELGLVTTFYDLNFGSVNKLFDESGKIIDTEKEAYIRRFERFMKELVWMSTVLRYGRLNVSVEGQQVETVAPNYHANKPCPEIAAKMEAETTDMFLQVTRTQTGKVEVTPVTQKK